MIFLKTNWTVFLWYCLVKSILDRDNREKRFLHIGHKDSFFFLSTLCIHSHFIECVERRKKQGRLTTDDYMSKWMVARCFPIPLFVLSLVKSINVINSIQQNMPLETNVVDKYVYIYIHLHKSGKVVVFFQ